MTVTTSGYFFSLHLFNVVKVHFFFQNEDKYKDVTIALAVIGGILLIINVLLIAREW